MAPPVAGRRRGRGPALLVAALLVIPIVEIAVIIAVGREIGGWPTFLLLLLESALGAWLVRREGARSWRALSEALNSGRMPSRQLADAALVLVGGTLLLTPGFVTDVVGFVFILPFTRPFTRRLLERVVQANLFSGLATFRSGPPAGPPGPGPTRPSGPAGEAGRRTHDDPDVIEGEIL